MSAEVVHRLGEALGVLLVSGWLLRRLAQVRRERRVARRPAALQAGAGETRRGARPGSPDAARRWLSAAGLVCAGWVVAGGLGGVVLGLAVAGAWWRWRGRQAAAQGAEACDRAEAARQLPLAADLVAACIAAGAGPVFAARAVGEALGGPAGDALARGAAEVRLGGDPAGAWRELAALPGAHALARLLERADVSGLPAATPVARLAADVRADRARTATARARRAAVMVTAPVGLCFLPAFVAVGVLPVVIGLAGGVLGGGGG
ncbi:type II secretion system F family protein [Streptomyces sediminimaris]|uniref:type II secretion system F family protein n=1 Tax=Streptomyces sediminimaris TaxID=3383721 RepID=UPI003999BFE4